MHSIRTNSLIRSVIITVTLLGWFVLSNHCALGRMARAAQVQKEHACCHNGQPKPDQAPSENSGVQCCRSLHATVADPGKVQLWPPTFVMAVLDAVLSLRDQTSEVLVQAHDTGPPPRLATFSELVLHRSLRSHAPPVIS